MTFKVSSDSFISHWFKTIGTFKGTMQATSKFPPAKDTWQSLYLVKQYLALMYAVEDHTDIIFADEKYLKEIDIYGKVRRDVYRGEVPTIKCNVNLRNQWNIMAACSVRRGIERALEYITIEEHSHLIEIDFLRQGDVLVVDNCSIHFSGQNSELQEKLWTEAGILMIPLPPYHPELNPIELVFNDLVQNLRAMSARYDGSVSNDQFVNTAETILSSSLFSSKDIKKKYKKRGYNV